MVDSFPTFCLRVFTYSSVRDFDVISTLEKSEVTNVESRRSAQMWGTHFSLGWFTFRLS